MKCFIIVVSFCVTIIKGQSIPCTTPNGENATCISLGSCPVLLEAFGRDTVSKKFVEASACPGGILMVCCGNSGNFTQNLSRTKEIAKLVKESSRDYVLRKNLLPSKKFCGLQHTDDYFYNETETSVDEFPWLVYFVIPEDYVKNYYSQKESNCVGVLISNLYILTSYEDCYLRIRGGLDEEFEYNSILLGQHHIYKDVSCIPTPFHVEDCTHPVTRVEAILFKTQFENGIQVIRLINKIEYSDYVRPICLPLDEDDMPIPGDTVFASGWGEDPFANEKSVKLKKRIKYTVMENKICKSGNPIPNPICGQSFDNNTHNICPGDNGGPLMYKHHNNWIVAGIVSNTVTCDKVHPVIAYRLTPKLIDNIYDAIVFVDKILVSLNLS